MKVIDQRGKFFGKINLIDLLVVLAILLVGIVLAGKLIGGGGDGLGGSTKLTYTVKVYDVKEEVYLAMQKISFPDQLMAAGDLLNGKVISMGAEKSQGKVYQVTPDQAGGMKLSTGEKETYDLSFIVEAYVANEVKNELGTQEIRLGKKHILKTTHFEFEESMITTCEQEKAS